MLRSTTILLPVASPRRQATHMPPLDLGGGGALPEVEWPALVVQLRDATVASP